MKYKSDISILRQSLNRSKAEGKISDTKILHVLHVCCREHAGEYHQAAEQRRSLHRQIAEKTENGMIAMVWSGMDCDCVKYQGDVRLVPATWQEIDKAATDKYEWADGPCSFYLERPSVAKQLRYSSRDLILEAFEDGHPHVVYY